MKKFRIKNIHKKLILLAILQLSISLSSVTFSWATGQERLDSQKELEDEEIVKVLGKGLSHERKLISNISKKSLLEMSGLVLKINENKEQSKNSLKTSNKSVLSASEALDFIKFATTSKKIELVNSDAEYFSTETLDSIALGDVGPQVKCLAEAVYFEARGEDLIGQSAVAEVILNRVDSKYFPNSICKVVAEGADRLNACQFSYNCDGKPEYVNERKAYERILKLSDIFYRGAARILTNGATFYHSKEVAPSWASKLKKTGEIGRHLFYRAERRLVQN